MARMLNLLWLIYCVVATPLKNAYLNEDKVSLDNDGPYSYIPSDAFVLDDVASSLTPSPNKKTVKKDLSRFERATISKFSPHYIDLVSKDKDYLKGCEELLQRSVPVRDLPNYIKFLRSLCSLNSQLGSAIGSRTKGNQLTGNVDGNLFTLYGNSNGELGNIYDGYAGNLGVGKEGKYGSNFGMTGNGVFGNLGEGMQGVLFGKISNDKSGQDDKFSPQDVWSPDYQKSILNLLLHDDGYVENLPKFAVHDHLSRNAKFSVGGEGFDGGHVEVEERKGGVIGTRELLEDDEVYNEGAILENVENPLNIKHDKNTQVHALGNDVADNLRDDTDVCDFESLLYNGKGGLVENLPFRENFSNSRTYVGNPCLHVYVLNGDNEKHNHHKFHSSSARYQTPVQLFGPMNGRREWTVLGGEDKRLRQYISMRKPWLIV